MLDRPCGCRTYAYLLEVGQIRGGGSAREMEASEEVRRVYLGG